MSAREALAVGGEKMLENVEGMAKLWLLPGNWIYNFAPSFKCPLLSDKSCLPIIRRHVNSSLARSLARLLTRRAFLWKRLVLQCGSPLTSTFINDVELSSASTPFIRLLVAPHPPPDVLLPLSENCGEINSFLFSCLFVQFPRRYYSKGFFFLFSPCPSGPFFELEKHRCRGQMSIFAHSRPS